MPFKDYKILLFFKKYFLSRHIIMESLSIEDVRNLFRLKKELNCNANKDTRNPLRQKKGTKAIKERILKDTSYFF